ncbi:MAG TPA: hypothetical protein VKB53_05195 [Gammaproteobacteria bacterium]|jgi:hypothetical protein|nr:hypothetical protein [Gammaproteobacteria bacterium]
MHSCNATKAIPAACQSPTLNRARARLLDLRHSLAIFMLVTLAMAAAVPEARAQLNPGDSLVVDPDAGTNNNGVLFRVDLVTGARTLLSDFGDAAMGR